MELHAACTTFVKRTCIRQDEFLLQRRWLAAAPGSVASPVSGSVLVRMVNAGLRMHVPFGRWWPAQPGIWARALGLIAEDGNPLPGVTRVQSEVFMAAGKTYDVTMNVPAASSTALPIFDRELSLSANSDLARRRHAGLSQRRWRWASSTGAFASTSAVANADAYNALVTGQTLTVSDPSKGVIANDIGVLWCSGWYRGTVTGRYSQPQHRWNIQVL